MPPQFESFKLTAKVGDKVRRREPPFSYIRGEEAAAVGTHEATVLAVIRLGQEVFYWLSHSSYKAPFTVTADNWVVVPPDRIGYIGVTPAGACSKILSNTLSARERATTEGFVMEVNLTKRTVRVID